MSNNNSITVLFFFCSIFLTYSQDITFNVNLKGSTYPTSKSHILRIVANSNGDGWNGDFLKLTDTDNDGIYSGIVRRVPKGEFLFQVREGEPGSPSWGTAIKPKDCMSSEFDGANYKAKITGDATFNFEIGKCLTSLPTANITFNVDLNGTKYPEAGKEIRIGGKAKGKGWSGKILVLTDADKDGIYSGTAMALPAGKLLFRVYQGLPGGNFDGDWISSNKGKKCAKDMSEETNHKIKIVSGQDHAINFKLNECLTIRSIK